MHFLIFCFLSKRTNYKAIIPQIMTELSCVNTLKCIMVFFWGGCFVWGVMLRVYSLLCSGIQLGSFRRLDGVLGIKLRSVLYKVNSLPIVLSTLTHYVLDEKRNQSSILEEGSFSSARLSLRNHFCSLWGPYGMPAIQPLLLHARQAPCPLYYFSSPGIRVIEW